jgi:hypothetical protein
VKKERKLLAILKSKIGTQKENTHKSIIAFYSFKGIRENGYNVCHMLLQIRELVSLLISL